jgi:multiple sugar transport system permease protein
MSVVQNAKRIKLTNLERRRRIAGWLFISPAVLGLLLWTILPVIASFLLSFTEYRIVSAPRWVGMENYVRMFTREPDFVQALKVTFNFVIMQLPIGLGIALTTALLLNTGVKAMTFFRTCFYLPSMVPVVATSLVWSWLLNLNYGLINQAILVVGGEPVNFFGSPKTALPTLAMMSWFSVGPTMVIYLAGLLNVPASLYEAAEIDGAGSVRKFLSITIPMLSPTIFFTIVMGLINSFQYFTQAFVLTSGGPLKSTFFYNLMIYMVGFQWLRMGYASALAWILLLIILVFTLLVFKSSAAWVYYEAGIRR